MSQKEQIAKLEAENEALKAELSAKNATIAELEELIADAANAGAASSVSTQPKPVKPFTPYEKELHGTVVTVKKPAFMLNGVSYSHEDLAIEEVYAALMAIEGQTVIAFTPVVVDAEETE